MYEIRKIRRDGMNKPDQQRLRGEDEREERELTSYVAQSIAKDMINSMPGARQPSGRPDEQKVSAQPQQVQWESTPYAPNQDNTRRDGR